VPTLFAVRSVIPPAAPSDQLGNICSVPAARPRSEFDNVKRLLKLELSDYEVARRSGIPRATVQNWRGRSSPPSKIRRRHELPPSPSKWRPTDSGSYGYLLGLYLGDGCIVVPPRGSDRLVLSLDESYPEIIARATHAMRTVLPGITIRRARRSGCRVISAVHPLWPYAFPQHGRGRKHTRRITLEDWQRELTNRHPQSLIRGLLHSDGSRVINRFKTRLPSGRIAKYAYVRYFFTNYSTDIRHIFCEHCDLLGVRWTQSSFKNISVAHRDSVAILDSFIGPKR
jgi:hypothetical protein